MNSEAYERLEPFIYRKSSRQRLILYLIADGYTVADLVNMDVPQLFSIKLPVELDVTRDEVLTGRTSGSAFAYVNGKRLPHTSYYRLIRSTCEKVLKVPMSQEKFRTYINKIALVNE